MTREEAINLLKQYIDYNNPNVPDFYTMEEACKVVIKALEQEPCEDAISRRDMALNIVSFYNKATGKKKTLDFLCKCVERLPSMQPKQRTGHWIDNQTRKDLCNCSECGALSKAYTKYCPNCGAKMEVTE
jgi:hypothetical protein